jgi:thiamine pyrophosphokinase
MSAPTVAYVFAGGDPLPAWVADVLVDEALVVAADSGLEHARALGRPVHLVVGDLDSVAPEVLEAAVAEGVPVEAHPADKDQTDLALAIEAAMGRGAERVVVVGGHGGRLDHLLANALVLTAPAYAGVLVDAVGGGGWLHVVHHERRLAAPPGATCTLLPVHGPARGVSTEGLRWPLAGETLEAGTSRGVSNVVEAPEIAVAVESGVLLVVLPAGPSR